MSARGDWHLQSLVFEQEWRVGMYRRGKLAGVMFDKGDVLGYAGVKHVPEHELRCAIWFASLLKSMDEAHMS